MAEERVQRRLAAILAADVVGYSRLIEQDEAETLASLKQRRRGILTPLVEQHQGRIVKVMGDGVLVEFGSAVNALACAVELQEKMAAANDGIADDRRILLRIGINLGDVVVEGGDLYGEGVIIAVRLQAMADPGGICLSGSVHEQVGNKLSLAFEDIGPCDVKNIARPVRVFRAQTDPQRPERAVMQQPISAIPSIAVLPFTNMSGDPEQEYFSDGITEDIITELSQFKNLLVIARNSAFQFKGKSIDIKEIGRRLALRYIVEGSVRKVGNRVRITSQLIEASTGNHVWAERYDRDLADLFTVQDEVVQAISAAIPGQIDRAAVAQIREKPPANLTAYDYELRGRWAFLHLADGLSVALDWFKRAVAADPGYALAHAGLGMTYAFGILNLGLAPEEARRLGIQHARQAVILDEGNCKVNACAAYTYHIAGEHKLTRKHAERAVALNPNDSFALYAMGCALSYTGDPEKAIEWIMSSARLDSFAPDDQRLDQLCDCYYMLHDYAKLLEIRETYQNVTALLHIVLAAALGQIGRYEEAQAAVRGYERMKPKGHDLQTVINNWMRMCSRTEDREHWLDGFRKAGIDI